MVTTCHPHPGSLVFDLIILDHVLGGGGQVRHAGRHLIFSVKALAG